MTHTISNPNPYPHANCNTYSACFSLCRLMFSPRSFYITFVIGLQATELWPPEAFLLNLKLLHERCIVMCQQVQKQQKGLGPGIGPELEHPCSSPTLSELTHRYVSTRISHSKVAGSNNNTGGLSSSSSSLSPSLSSSKSFQSTSGAINRSGMTSTKTPSTRAFSKNTLGPSAIGQENIGSPMVHEDDDYEDD